MPTLSSADIHRLCGWRPNTAKINAYRSGRFCVRDLPLQALTNGDALLWEHTQAVTGSHLAAHEQQRGTCTSHGWSSAADYLQCADIALGRANAPYTPVSHAAYYGFGREVAGLLGDEDGCYGAAMAQAGETLGHVSNDEANDEDDDDALAVAWGSKGVPSELRPPALNHRTLKVALCPSAADARAALQAGYPVPIASNQGFTLTRDRDGFCRPKGTWMHLMCLIGYRADRDWFCILQSWGQNVPDGPLALDQPDCSFWTDARTVEKMLAQGDSYGLVSVNWWPAPSPPPPPPPPADEVYLVLENDLRAGRYRLDTVTHGLRRPAMELPPAVRADWIRFAACCASKIAWGMPLVEAVISCLASLQHERGK